jgi:hypothetical protein
MPRQPNHQEISRRAYEIYQKRGGESGHDVEDWLQATSELTHEMSEVPSNVERGRATEVVREQSKRAVAGSKNNP